MNIVAFILLMGMSVFAFFYGEVEPPDDGNPYSLSEEATRVLNIVFRIVFLCCFCVGLICLFKELRV